MIDEEGEIDSDDHKEGHPKCIPQNSAARK